MSNSKDFTSISHVPQPEPITVFRSSTDVNNRYSYISLNGEYSTDSSNWIKLNVGGKEFLTTVDTLVNKEPTCMLARMFSPNSGMTPSNLDGNGAYLIDRSGQYFEPILNYLRHGQLIVDNHLCLEGILEEAKFYGIDSLINQVNLMIPQKCGPIDPPLTRRDVVNALIQTRISDELRFQGVNLTGADLRRLDLRKINFKYANLSRCNLTMANLSQCNFERADLSFANLEGAQLVSVKGNCANMEGANLRDCNFEDTSGSDLSNLEGVNLRGACLEGSNMAQTNMRVANLKDANLKNCNLRLALLAGADLERCNLSGSDLQDANLRGANLKDAELELMLTPLHMSQAIR